ncbi:MAG: Coenzyme F420 hydrogenase/dehydrogenase, beta subunit C-terminal domain [Bacillota bacterium]
MEDSHRIIVARASSPLIREVAQDGGVVTSILLHCIRAGYRGAIVCQKDETWHPVPAIATCAEAVLSAAGTCYTYSPMLKAVTALPSTGKFVMVGTSCHVRALRRLQSAANQAARSIGFVIGLFCSHSFTYDGLITQKIQRELGIDPCCIKKMNIKGKLRLELVTGECVEVPLKELKPFQRQCCSRCPDFTCEEADVSVGGLGLDGKNFVIPRTQLGMALLRELVESKQLEVWPAEQFPSQMELLAKVSSNKRQRARGGDGIECLRQGFVAGPRL